MKRIAAIAVLTLLVSATTLIPKQATSAPEPCSQGMIVWHVNNNEPNSILVGGNDLRSALCQVQVYDPTPVRPTIPACQEDEIVTGLGEFNGAERGWTSYECQNLDNFVDFVNSERIGGRP